MKADLIIQCSEHPYQCHSITKRCSYKTNEDATCCKYIVLNRNLPDRGAWHTSIKTRREMANTVASAYTSKCQSRARPQCPSRTSSAAASSHRCRPKARVEVREKKNNAKPATNTSCDTDNPAHNAYTPYSSQYTATCRNTRVPTRISVVVSTIY